MEFVSGNTDVVLFTAIGVLALLTLILIGIVIHLHRSLRRFLYGKNAQTLEDTILNIKEDAKALANGQDRADERLSRLEDRMSYSIQGVDVVRFSAFNEGGGQSFASAFVNEHGDGVIISTLYAREQVRVFAKPVTNGSSAYELSDEEKQAITNAYQRTQGDRASTSS